MEHYQSSEDVVVVLCHHSHHLGLQQCMGKKVDGEVEMKLKERKKCKTMKKVSTSIYNQYKRPSQKRKPNVFTSAEWMKITSLYVHID